MDKHIKIDARLFIIHFAFILTIALPNNATGQSSWHEDFESYATGSFPSQNWTYSGNSDIKIDSTIYISGNKSVRLLGVIGSCWGALLHRPRLANAQDTIEFYIRNGSEQLSGCHPIRGRVGLNTGPDWATSHRGLIDFQGDGTIRSGKDSVIATYNTDTWIKVRISYLSTTSITLLSYWINDIFIWTDTSATLPFENDLSYITVCADEGSTWFDDIRVTSVTTRISQQSSIKPQEFRIFQNYPNPFNPSTTIRYALPYRSQVKITIFNMLGQKIMELLDEQQEAGQFEKVWNAKLHLDYMYTVSKQFP